MSGILDVEDRHGDHHLFRFTEYEGALCGDCGRMLLGVMHDTPGEYRVLQNPADILRLLVKHSMPVSPTCRLVLVLYDTTVVDLGLRASQRIHARKCAVSFYA